MSSRRTLILVGALVSGLLAAFLTFRYVGGIEERAQGEAQLTPVVIATAPIPVGASADEAIATAMVNVGERRQVDIPADAVRRTAEIKGMKAQIDIQPGTIITAGMFGTENVATDGATAVIGDGMVFTSISVDDTRGVAQLVKPGDYVNITAIGRCTAGTTEFVAADSGDEGPATEPCSMSLYQKARVVAVGQSLGTAVAAPVGPDGQPTEQVVQASPLLTFELPPEPAQVVQTAASTGVVTLHLSLVRKDYVPAPINPTVLIPATGKDGGTPYGGDPEAAKIGQ